MRNETGLDSYNEMLAEEAASRGDETDEGFDVEDEFEVSGLEDQTDVLPAGRGVLFTIEKAAIRTKTLNPRSQVVSDDNPWTEKDLVLHLKVGSKGVDGKGYGKGRKIFPEHRLALNMEAVKEKHRRQQEENKRQGKETKEFNALWWKEQARLEAKQLFTALGIAFNSKINDKFLADLKGRKVIGDVTLETQLNGNQVNRARNYRPAPEVKSGEEIE